MSSELSRVWWEGERARAVWFDGFVLITLVHSCQQGPSWPITKLVGSYDQCMQYTVERVHHRTDRVPRSTALSQNPQEQLRSRNNRSCDAMLFDRRKQLGMKRSAGAKQGRNGSKKPLAPSSRDVRDKDRSKDSPGRCALICTRKTFLRDRSEAMFDFAVEVLDFGQFCSFCTVFASDRGSGCAQPA